MRRLAVVLGALSMLVLSSPARAHVGSCLALEPDCLDDIVTTDPDEVLDDPVGEIVDQVDGAEDTTDPVVDPVLDVVDDVLNGGDPILPPGGDGPAAHESGPGTKAGGGERPGRDPGSPVARSGALGREAFIAQAPQETLIGSAATAIRPPLPPHGSPERFDGIIEGAVRGLLLLAVLFGVTVAFVMVQGRMDRNDPKLIGAPVRTEVVTFA
jgi:hypothetical protein